MSNENTREWRSDPSRFAPVNHMDEPIREKQSNAGCLCFFLGAFGILGVIAAAIIAKKDGAIAALWGWFVTWIGGCLLWFLGFAFLLDYLHSI